MPAQQKRASERFRSMYMRAPSDRSCRPPLALTCFFAVKGLRVPSEARQSRSLFPLTPRTARSGTGGQTGVLCPVPLAPVSPVQPATCPNPKCRLSTGAYHSPWYWYRHGCYSPCSALISQLRSTDTSVNAPARTSLKCDFVFGGRSMWD
ncbi:hypothetical protein BJV78DRAFT_369405 [Lactifluus subvellereus]|nr:hypothetical protein BJV78DRAFT_369405 [Lactifluus subvellereus]